MCCIVLCDIVFVNFMAKISQIEGELKTFQELLEEVADDEEISSIRGFVQEFVNELSPELFFNIDVQRLINKFLWETRDALGFSCMADTFSAYGDGFVEEISFGKLNVRFFNSKYTFVLPDETENSVIPGNGNGFEEKETLPRVRLMYEVLADLGIENVAVYDGITLSSQFRKVPYKLFIIEELDRALLICEESGNRTFVKSGLADLEKFSFSRKSELKERDDVRGIVWNGAENWKERMEELLVLDFEEVEPSFGDDAVESIEDGEECEEGGIYPKMDREYFTKANVKKDLDAYCKEAKLAEISKLNTNFKKLNALCVNGEVVRYITYLSRASNALSGGKYTIGQALDELKRIYGLRIEVRQKGVIQMDKKYFTKENVKYDLDAYCKEMGVSDVSKLHANLQKLKAVCINGEIVRFKTYLMRASRNLGNGELTPRQALDVLKRIYGLEIKVKQKVHLKMDKVYFTEENVKRDLEAYCRVARVSDVSKLTTNFLKIEALCGNGEILKFMTYLDRVSRYLNDGKLTYRQALDVLKRIYGFKIEEEKEYPKMDRAYFTEENVKKDLMAYCKAAGLSDVSKLSINHKLSGIESVCCKGEIVKLQTYLLRASKALSDGKFTVGQALDELKKMIS